MQIWAGKHIFGTRALKHKLGTRAGKYKSGARAGKYKLGTRAGSQAKGWGSSKEPGACKYKYPVSTVLFKNDAILYCNHL